MDIILLNIVDTPFIEQRYSSSYSGSGVILNWLDIEHIK
jgi:hypothetical protein